MADESYSGVDNLEVLADAANYNRFLVDAVVRASRGADSAVDFGAGEGTLTAAVRKRGLTVTCIEQDPRLRGRLHDHGFETYADLKEVADGTLEFVYSLNVLEHIEDDQASLAALYSKLMPGGRLFLYLPALQVLFSSMDEKIGHHRRYSKRGLVRIGGEAGFIVESIEYADSLGFPLTLLYKLVGSRRGDISSASVKVYDRLFFPLSRAIDRVGASRLFGKNLMAIMRRPSGAVTQR